MELKEMTIEQLKTRLAEIPAELEKDGADLNTLEQEVSDIKAEMEARKAAAREAEELRSKVAAGAGEVIDKIHTEDKAMTNEEVRKSHAYAVAYGNYLKSEDDAECRALLTENVNGKVPVPVMVEGIIAKAYEASKILSRVRKSYAKGNVKVGFELSAPIATVHTEGSGEHLEENLQLGIVTLVPETLKKWVSISDEALETMEGETLLSYVYEEITRKIVAAEEKKVIDAILAAPQTATATAPAVGKLAVSAVGVADFINARALVTSGAADLVAIMTPALRAKYRAAAIGANFAFDVFDGMSVIESDYATSPIVGDLAGILANYPAGDDITFKFDDTTLMTSDLVRVLGRKPVAAEVVGNNFLAKIVIG